MFDWGEIIKKSPFLCLSKPENDVEKIDKGELNKAIDSINYFLDSVPCAMSGWLDEKGNLHGNDMGYVYEFLDDLKLYLSVDRLSTDKLQNL